MPAWLTTVHRWVGLALAAVLLAVSATGVLLLARGPYYRWQYPAFAAPITTADAATHLAALDTLAARLRAEIRTVKLPQPGMHVFHLYLADGSEAFVDPHTGATLDRWHAADRLPAFLFDLHAHLLGGHTGEIVNGVAAVLAIVFLVLGGVLVWWPRRKAMRLRGAWPSSLSAAALLRSHAAIGALTALPLLLFLVTGAGIALSTWVTPWLARTFDGPRPARAAVIVAPAAAAPAPWSAIVRAIEQAADRHAGAGRVRPQLVFFTPSSKGGVPHSARVRLPGEWHPNGRSVFSVHPVTASVLQVVDARHEGAGTRASHLLYPLHAARVAGTTAVTLVVLAVAAGGGLAALSLSGTYTWARRQRVFARRPRTAPVALDHRVRP
jgi:uncharacterized iron-regulated membrane protein